MASLVGEEAESLCGCRGHLTRSLSAAQGRLPAQTVWRRKSRVARGRSGLARGLSHGLVQRLNQGRAQGLVHGVNQGLRRGLEQGLGQGLVQETRRGERRLRQLARKGRRAERARLAERARRAAPLRRAPGGRARTARTPVPPPRAVRLPRVQAVGHLPRTRHRWASMAGAPGHRKSPQRLPPSPRSPPASVPRRLLLEDLRPAYRLRGRSPSPV